jgi:hypothetical protein
MQARTGVLLLGVGLAAGIWIGRLVAQRGVHDDVDALVKERDALKSRADKAEADLATAKETKRRRENANPNVPAGAIPPGSRSPSDSDAEPPKAAPAKPVALTPEARTRRVNEIRGMLATIFQNHEGEKALAALKELAALAPEGRDDAMKLALDINKDVEGPGALHLPMQTFYTGLGDPAIRDLMTWSLDNQASSTADFRVLSAWSLPWTQGPIDDTIAHFDAALSHETDRGVQKAIVDNLGQINSPKAEAALMRVLADGTRDAALHGDAAMALATSDDPAAQRAVAAAAAADSTNQRIQTAAKVSLVVRDPPATGCLVVQTTPDGTAESAGVRAADVIVSYNGRVVSTESDLRNEIKQAAGAETVSVVVVRDGAQQTLQMKPTRIDRGTAFKPVEKK